MKKKILLVVIILVIAFPFIYFERGTTESTNHYSDKTGGAYNCSKPIQVITRPNIHYYVWNITHYNVGISGYPLSRTYSEPVNPAEANLFCRTVLFTESEGILTVLQKPE